MTTAIVAVIGTLLGALTAGFIQNLTTVAVRRDRDREAHAAFQEAAARHLRRARR